ncbi:MAG: transcriptional repressor [Pyrinomonadaceae bacterium MAG19_C2-C3]|nr:transcriptional repressor [Pyrinomonadaceae bacterium MAG19_C2-C3]
MAVSPIMSQEKQQFYRHLQRAGLKRTAQRDLIVDIFLHTEDHLSSEDLYRVVKEQDASIGQTTIYRTLKLLVEAGLASEVRFGDGRSRYEPNNKFPHHDHLICTNCNHTIEFYSAELKAMLESIAAAHNFHPTEQSLRIFGLCAACAVDAASDSPPAINKSSAPGAFGIAK